MNNFKNIAKSLTATININCLISKKNINLINPVALCTGLFCLLSVTIFSCTKDGTYPFRHPSLATTSLMVVQGGINITKEDIYLGIDNKSVSSQPLIYGDHTDYLSAFAGGHVVQVGEHGPGVLTYVGLASDTVFLNPGNSYSLFLWSTSTATTNDYPGTRINNQVGFTLLTDSLSKPAAGQAKIRFVDVSLNAGPVDLVMNGNVLVPNKTIGGYSLFMPVSPTTSGNFEVRENGSSVILSTLKNINIKSGGIYTLWLYGSASGTQNTGLNLGIITNKQY